MSETVSSELSPEAAVAGAAAAEAVESIQEAVATAETAEHAETTAEAAAGLSEAAAGTATEAAAQAEAATDVAATGAETALAAGDLASEAAIGAETAHTRITGLQERYDELRTYLTEAHAKLDRLLEGKQPAEHVEEVQVSEPSGESTQSSETTTRPSDIRRRRFGH